MSVTTWNHSHFAHFDADAIIDKMMAGNKWQQSKYYGQTKDEIKSGWEANGKEASEAGTNMHYDIECFYNLCPNANDSIEYKYFQDFVKDYGHLKPYRTEWMIYDEELRFAGSIDMLFENEDGTLEIYDWKRCKEIKKENRWQSSTTECISHLPDCNYWHYSLQLNTYKAILEKNYNVKINGMYLVCLHPNNENNSYLRIKVEDMTKEINDLFELRQQILLEPDSSEE
jgi:ATP-dependent exoDNAse (exonuclease V) beta subunit